MNNDLNMILSAKVVKLKVQLDAKGSNLPSQIIAISTLLKDKPVKLRVNLAMNQKEASAEVAKIRRIVGAKPIRVKLDVDASGVNNLGTSLNKMNKQMATFNKNYEGQARNISASKKKIEKAMVINTPSNGGVANFNNIKQYNRALLETEQILRSKIPKGMQAAFSMTQFKDAQGNIKSMVGTLQRADGIKESIQLAWDRDADKFVPMNRKSVIAVQKGVAAQKKAIYELTQARDRDWAQTKSMTRRNQYDGLIKGVRNFTTGIQDATLASRKMQDEFKKGVAMANKMSEKSIVPSGSKEAGILKSMFDADEAKGMDEFLKKYKGLHAQQIKINDNNKALGASMSEIKVRMAGTGKTVDTLTYAYNRNTGALSQLGNATQDLNPNRNLGWFEQMKIAMKRVPVWMAAMTAFYGTIAQLRMMVSTILEVDKAMTELKRVASSNLNIDQVFQMSVDLSKELGNNLHDILGGVADLARTYGEFNERQLIAVTRTAVLMSNVSELDIETATKTLVGTMNAFNIEAEESIRIVDALNEVDNNYAISTQQLAEGLQKSASTAQTFGVSMEESAGHITAIGSVTMESGRQIGNGLKTIYSRITTLDSSKGILEGVGVAMYEIGESGEKSIRPVNDILSDLAGKWGGLSAEQQQNIAVTVAGRYQLSRFLALMNSWDTATGATTTALSSQGSAMRENARYMESYEAKINKMKNSFSELALTIGEKVMNSSITIFLDGLTDIANKAEAVVDKVGAVPAALGGMAAIAFAFGAFNKPIALLTTGINAVRTAYTTANTAQSRFAAGTKTVAAGSAVASGAMKGMATAAAIAGRALKGVISATVIGAVFVGLGMVVEGIIAKYRKSKELAEEIEKTNNTLIDSYRNTEGGLDKLIEDQARLQDLVDSGKIKKGTTEYQEYVGVTNQLAELMPSVVKYVDQSGLAHLRESDAIQEQYKHAEKLSNLKAEMTQNNFLSDMKEVQKAYDAETEAIKKLIEEKERLAKTGVPSGEGRGIQAQTGIVGGINLPDATKNQEKLVEKQLELDFEMLQSEQAKQDAIQQTLILSQDNALAYLESNKHLKTLGDSGMAFIETFHQANEEFLRSAESQGTTIEERGKELSVLASEIGTMIAETKADLTEGVDDPLQINEIKNNFDMLLNSVPKSFFDMQNFKDAEEFQVRMEAILSVADKVQNREGSFSAITRDLRDLGFTSEEATAIAENLGKAYNNQEIRMEAMANQTGEAAGEQEDLNEAMAEAVELSQQLVGKTGEQVDGLLGHIETMKTMNAIYGENANTTDAYLSSLEAIQSETGLDPAMIEKDLDYLKNVLTLTQEAELQYDEVTGALIGWNDEALNPAQVNMLDKVRRLAEESGIEYNLLTGEMIDMKTQTELVVDEQGNVVEAIRDATGELVKNPKNGQQAAVFQTGEEAKNTLSHIKDMTKGMDEFVDKTIEAVDITETFFGFKDEDVEAMKSHLENAIMFREAYGEAGKEAGEFKESISELSKFLGLPEEVIEADLDYYYNSLTMMDNLKLKQDEVTGQFEGFVTEDMNREERRIWNEMQHHAEKHGIELDQVRRRWYYIGTEQEVVFDSAGKLYKVWRDANDEITRKPPYNAQEAAAKEAEKAQKEYKKSIEDSNKAIENSKVKDLYKDLPEESAKAVEETKKVKKSFDETKKAKEDLKREKMFDGSDTTAGQAVELNKSVKEASKEAQDQFRRTKDEKMFNEADMSAPEAEFKVKKLREEHNTTAEAIERNKQKDLYDKTDDSPEVVEKKVKKVAEAHDDATSRIIANKQTDLYDDTDTSADTAEAKSKGVGDAHDETANKIRRNNEQPMFNPEDDSPEKTKEKVDKVKRSIEDMIKTVQDAKKQKLFEDAGMEKGKGADAGYSVVHNLSDAIIKATESATIVAELEASVKKTTAQIQIMLDRMVQAGEYSGKITGVIGSIERLNTATGNLVTDLSSADKKIGTIFTALPGKISAINTPIANANTLIRNMDDVADGAWKKVNNLTSMMTILADVGVGGLPNYNTILKEIATSLLTVRDNSIKTANTQDDVINALGRVIAAADTYNSRLKNIGDEVNTSFENTAFVIRTVTKKIIDEYGINQSTLKLTTSRIKKFLEDSALDWSQFGAVVGTLNGYLEKQYEKNAKNVMDMVTAVRKQLGIMVQNFEVSSRNATTAVTNMADDMAKAYRRGILDVVHASEELPNRIGQAIRRNMSDATSAMDALAKNLVKRFKVELGIKSPSRVFEDLGGWVIKGLANGLTGSDLTSLGKQVFNDFGGGAFSSIDQIKDYLQFGANDFGVAGFSGFKRTSGFGMRTHPITGQKKLHAGVDFAGAHGSPIFANVGGRVVASGASGNGFGNWVKIQRGDMSFIYAHLSRAIARVGANVKKGQLLGLMGSTGASTGTHLHYEVRRNGRAINPEGYEHGGEIKNEKIIRVGEKDKAEMIIPLEQHRDRAKALWTETGDRLGMFNYYAKGGVTKPSTYKVKRGDTLSEIAVQFGMSVKAIMDLNKSIKNSNKIQVGQVLTLKSIASNTKKKSTPSYSLTSPIAGADRKVKAKGDIAESYAQDVFTLKSGDETAAISLLEGKLQSIGKESVQYRDTMKEIVKHQENLVLLERKELDKLKNRNGFIRRALASLPELNKQTASQRERYNELLSEYDSNASKIHSMRQSIEDLGRDIKAKSVEIFSNFIQEIVNNYDKAIDEVEWKLGKIDLYIQTNEISNPDDKKRLAELKAMRLEELKIQKEMAENKYKSLNLEHNAISRKKGHWSPEAKAAFEARAQAVKEMEDLKIAVLQAEKDIQDVRASVADEGISQLKDYYGKMRDMATQAIDAEIRELEKSHEKKIKLLDEEAQKINDVYDERLKQMDKTKEEESYQAELSEKNARKAELVNKIALAARDTSLEGRKRLAELQSELADVNKEISETTKARQDELLREAIDKQRQEQLDKLEKEKEAEEKLLADKVLSLEEQKIAVQKHYDDILNNDQYWAEMRNQFIAGSFEKLKSELTLMKENLDAMNQGIFDGLFAEFKDLSAEVKKEIAELNGLDVDNMIFNSKDAIGDVGEVSEAKKPKSSEPTKPLQTPVINTTKAKQPVAKPKPAPKPKPKPAPKPKSKNNREVTSAVNFRKSPAYGNNVIGVLSKGTKVEFIGMERGWAKIKNGSKTGFVGSSFLKSFDTGGYTGKWPGGKGKLAMLHSEELILNKKETNDVIDVTHLLDRALKVVPNIIKPSIEKQKETVEGVSITNNYDIDINIERLNGTKKDADVLSERLLKNIRKSGK